MFRCGFQFRRVQKQLVKSMGNQRLRRSCGLELRTSPSRACARAAHRPTSPPRVSVFLFGAHFIGIPQQLVKSIGVAHFAVARACARGTHRPTHPPREFRYFFLVHTLLVYHSSWRRSLNFDVRTVRCTSAPASAGVGRRVGGVAPRRARAGRGAGLARSRVREVTAERHRTAQAGSKTTLV